MRWPLQETLQFIEPSVPPALVSAQAFTHIKQLAQQLPTGLSSYYLECRLTTEAEQVDFLACATTPEGGRELLAGKNTAFPPHLLEASLWQRIHHFCRQWATPTSALHARVPLVWFEFDHAESTPSALPSPSFCFCLDRTYLQRGSWSQRQPSQDSGQDKNLAKNGLQLLLDQPLARQNEHVFDTCFDALPEGGRIIHISAMIARQPSVVKLYGVVPTVQLVPYLTRLGWPGSFRELAAIMADFCRTNTVDHNTYLDLSLGASISPRLGLAFAQQQIEQLPGQDFARRALLDLCVQHGLCSPAKRDALVLWPGRLRAVFPGDTLPTRFRKWLDIKLVYHPDQPLEAKGYLGFMPYFSLF